MADLTYTVDINGVPALTALNKIESQVAKLKTSFSGLQSAIASIGFGTIISGAIKLADSISDLSDATEISIDKVLGFSAAIQANGGSVEGAQKGMAKLVASIDDAANSAGSGREAFKDVGVSLTDLRTKTSSQIFDQAIKGLSGITDVATRARLATELLGKEAKLVNFKNVAADFDEASAKAARYSDAIKSGADANDNIAAAIKTLQLELLKAIQPITDFINGVKVSTDAVGKFFDILASAAKWAIFIAGLTLIGRGLYLLGAAAVAAYSAITEITGGIIGLFRALSNPLTRSNLLVTLEELGGGLGTQINTVLNAMGINTAFLAKHWLGLSAAIGGAIGAMKEWSGIGKTQEGPQGRSYSADDTKRMQDYLDEQQAKIKRGQEAMAKFNAEVAKAALNSKQSLSMQGQELSNMSTRLAFEKNIVGLTDDQKEVQTKLFDLEMARIGKQEEFARIIQKLEQEKSLTKDEEANRLLGVKIGLIKKEATDTDNLFIAFKQGIGEQIVALQSAKMIEAARLQDQQNMVKAIEDQIARQQTLAGILQGINDKKVDQGFETAQAGRNPLEKQMAQIQENARKAALEAGRAFSAGFENMDLSSAQAKELADGLDQIAKAYQGIAQSEMDSLTASRSWDAGWKTAFDNYMDNATNAATRAGEVFGAITSNMNSAIDNFVDSGKSSFEDLAKSIIQDLIKIELKAQATKLLGMIGGGGGIFSAIGSLLGFAEGGSPPINKPSIVGEKGPELFVPRTAGTIIPNGAGMGGGVVNKTYITNNISAIDSKSVAQMFAENRKSLLGTVQLAQKELPYGNR